MPQQPHILIVDDDEEDRLLMEMAFEQIAISGGVHFAAGGVQVFQYLDALAEDFSFPSLIVLDLNMPMPDGIEILKRLKSHPRYKYISVIIFSTSMHALEKDQCLTLGAADCIKKPANFREMQSIAQFLFIYALDNTKP